MAKTNAQYLRDILEKIEGDGAKEALEFVDGVESEIDDLKSDYEDLKRELDDTKDELTKEEERVSELQSELNDIENNTMSNESDLGLDKLNWELQGGNIILTQKIEDFIEQIQKEYAVIPS